MDNRNCIKKQLINQEEELVFLIGNHVNLGNLKKENQVKRLKMMKIFGKLIIV